MGRCSIPQNRRGLAAVEAAVVMPLILLLVFGFIEVGYYLNSHQILHDAARQGARAAVRTEYSNADVHNAVTRSLANSSSIDAADVTVTMAKLDDFGNEEYQIQNLNENEQGHAVRVTVTVDYSQFNPPSNFVGIAAGTISGSAVMQRQQ